MCVLSFSCSKDNDTEDLTPHSYSHSDIELDLISKINNYRNSQGLTTLSIVEHVSYKCSEHNDYMISKNTASNDYFYQRSENIKKVCNSTKVSEVIAVNYQTNQSVLQAWINDVTCNEILLKSDSNRIGLSIRENSNQKKYYTVILIN